MRRILASSALFGLAVVAAAFAQPGTNADKKAADKKVVGQKLYEKPADPADAAIAAALAHDPDVRMARAKVQLAEAELAKARQSVTVKVITLRATIEEQKAAVAIAQETFALTERLVKSGQAALAELNQARAKLEAAKAGLARAELELKLITGGGLAGAAAADPHHAGLAFNTFIGWLDTPACTACHAVPGAAGAAPPKADAPHPLGFRDANAAVRQGNLEMGRLFYLNSQRAAEAALGVSASVRGAIPDRVRAALDRKVKVGEKGQKVPLTKALEVFKTEAGLDVPVRGVGDHEVAPVVTTQGEEMTVRAWLQLFEDYSAGGRFYVREYGLLFTIKDQAPPDALTLTQFGEIRAATKKDDKPKEGPDKK